MSPEPAVHHVYRTCPLCEAHCGLDVSLDASRTSVVTIRGDRQDPMSRGYICPKAYGLKGLHEDPDRLTRPMVREGGQLREVEWDVAIERAAEGLAGLREQHGADSVALYIGNPTAHDMGSLLYLQPLSQALATRWLFTAASADQLPKNLSSRLMFGGSYTIPIPDVDRTGYLLVLGANPLVSNGSLMTAPDFPKRLEALRARGGKLVVIDPRRSETARRADEHHFIRPGSDALLMLALAHTLFDEERVDLGAAARLVNGVERVRELARDFAPERVEQATGIAAETIRRLARELADAPSAACYGRIGTCTQQFGTLASWGIDLVNVLTGNLDRAGGAMFPTSAASLGGLVSEPPGTLPYGRWHTRVRGLPEVDGQLPVAALAEEIDSAGSERVRGLVTHAGNPVLSTPDGARLGAALEQLDFMVSIDFYLNETTRFADVVLPPTSPLERSNCDLFFYPLAIRNGVHYSPAALEPPVHARQPWQILLELGAALAGTSAEALDDLMLHGMAALAGLGEEGVSALGPIRGPDRLLDLLLRTGPYRLALRDLDPHGTDLGPLQPHLGDVLNTASGKVELAPDLIVADVDRLRASLEEPAPELVLIGRRQTRSNNSWMHNVASLAKGPERCTLLMHSDDAERRGIETGSRVLVRSRAGKLEVPVETSDDLMPGVVSLPHGFGHTDPHSRLGVAKRAQAGANSNQLAESDRIDTLSGTIVLNGIPVEIEPLA